MNRQIAYFESLKNIFKKMMLFWIEDEDNYDDFEDNIRIL